MEHRRWQPFKSNCTSPGSQVGVLPPSPLRTAREGFPSSSSSISKGPLQHPVGLFTPTFTLLLGCQRALPRDAAPVHFSAVICFAASVGLAASRVTSHQREVRPLARGARAPLRSLTARPSLAPSSHTPTPISSLTVHFPVPVRCGLTTFRVRILDWGRSRQSPGGITSTVREGGPSYPQPHALWAPASPRLWLVGSAAV